MADAQQIAVRINDRKFAHSPGLAVEQVLARDAASGQVGALVPTYRRVLLLCYDYDSAAGRYSANVLKMVRAGGVLIVLILGVCVAVALVRERRAAARRAAASGEDHA